MRKNVGHREIRPPLGLIKIEPVLFESGQINNAKIRTARRIEWGGFAQIIPTGPNKLSANKRVAFLGKKFFVRRGGPFREIEIVGTHMMSHRILPGICRRNRPKSRCDGEEVFAATANRGSGFAAVNKSGREVCVENRVHRWPAAAARSPIIQTHRINGGWEGALCGGV